MNAEELIIRKIRKEGPIPFRDFMELALYAQDFGYYMSPGHKTGKRGDFFTSPYISSAFGSMIARQLDEIWQQLGGRFTVVEYGAGTGLLCYDILKYLKQYSDCYSELRYVIIEKSPVLRSLSRKYLTEKVIWIDDLEELGDFQGCVLSNELIDNFPVHRIHMKDRPMEIFVDFELGFREIIKPVNERLANIMKDLKIELARDECIEICHDAQKWLENISRYLKKGCVITIDYGYLGYDSRRWSNIRNTLRCYYQHQLNSNLYEKIGQQDLTADVDFSALSFWGIQQGLQISGFVNQGFFLRGLGFNSWLYEMEETDENKRYAVQTLLNRMGSQFKVLIQRKEMPDLPLQGLTFQAPDEKSVLIAMNAESYSGKII